MDSCESRDTGQGTFRPSTESFSFKHALLHLIILLKPAYQGYFNPIGSAPFLALSKGVKGDQGRFFIVYCLWAKGIKGDQGGSRGIKGDQGGSKGIKGVRYG